MRAHGELWIIMITLWLLYWVLSSSLFVPVAILRNAMPTDACHVIWSHWMMTKLHNTSRAKRLSFRVCFKFGTSGMPRIQRGTSELSSGRC